MSVFDITPTTDSSLTTGMASTRFATINRAAATALESLPMVMSGSDMMPSATCSTFRTYRFFLDACVFHLSHHHDVF
jgi:hypothetical protein